MKTLDKIRAMSKPKQQKFDEILDLRTDGTIDNFNVKEFTEKSLADLNNHISKGGANVETKVIGVALRVAMRNPNDKADDKFVVGEIIFNHPKVKLAEIISSAEGELKDIDSRELKMDENEDAPYEPKSKYDGHMYG